MKIRLDSQELQQALHQVKPIKSSGLLPILTNAHFSITGNKALVTGSNLEVTTTVELASELDYVEPFSLLIPLRITETFLQGERGIATIEKAENNDILLYCNGLGHCTFPHSPYSVDTKFYPPTPHEDNLHWSSLDAKWFCRMLSIAINTCAPEETRPVLTGILCKDGAMASADGFRMVSIKSDKLTFGLASREFILPSLSARHVCKLFNKSDSIYIALGENNRAYFKSGNISMVANLIIGKYPDYEKLIPENFNCKVSFSTPLMLQRLSMIGLCDSDMIRLTFLKKQQPPEEECLIGATNSDICEYSLNLPVKIEVGDEAKIFFNHHYIIDAIKYFSLATVELTSPSSPAKFTGDIEELAIIVMPMFYHW